MAKAADAAGIQWRRLNASKGPAVRATRCQADRGLYRAYIRRAVEAQPNLTIFQSAVDDLLIEPDGSGNDRVRGALTNTGLRFEAPAVVLTAGTFLAGRIHVGQTQYAGGRMGDPPATTLAAKLRERPFAVDRLKTGTPPRSEEHTSELQSLMRISYAVFCLKQQTLSATCRMIVIGRPKQEQHKSGNGKHKVRTKNKKVTLISTILQDIINH